MTLEVMNVIKDWPLPSYATENSSGMDLISVESKILRPFDKWLFSTGLKMAIPCGFEGQIRPRSGLAWNHGVTVLNSPGTIDCDYRGIIKVMLINLSNKDYSVKEGDKIAQLVFVKYEKFTLKEVSELDATIRGENGFGSTGRDIIL